MTDYTELKRLAEAVGTGKTFDELMHQQHLFSMQCKPAAVLALIAENEALKSELEAVKTDFDSAAELISSLRKDAERYRWLRQYTVDSYGAQGSFGALDRDIDASMAREAPSD